MSQQQAIFSDEDYLDRLVAVLARDITSLKQCSGLLKADDFKPIKGMTWGRPRWVIAERILSFYKDHHTAVGKLLRVELLDYAEKLKLGERQVAEIEQYLKHLKKIPTQTPSAVTEKVVRYKEERLRAAVLEEMSEHQAAGTLTPEIWQKLTQKALRTSNHNSHSVDFFSRAELRSEQRLKQAGSTNTRIPHFFIDPLDALTRGVGPKQLGLIIAPTNRGKSLAMRWLALKFCVQGFRVLLVTLEDPLEEYENALDAAVTGIPMDELPEYPKRFGRRFHGYRRRMGLDNRLRIIDGSDEKVTVSRLEQMVLEERERGFQADVLLIDYDDFIAPETRHKEKRYDSDETYLDIKQQMGAKYDLVVWIAAQTQRNTSKMKILSGDRVAEDIGKARKATMIVTLGQGEWGEDSIFLWVAKHKFGRKHVGCHIMPDLERGLLYDRELTRKAALQYEAREDRDEESEDEE